MNARRLILGVCVWSCSLLGLLTVAGVPAQARITHEYLPALSEKLSEAVPATGPHGEAIALPGARPLEPSAAAVDSGRLWVFEATPGFGPTRIDEYDASTGAFMAQIAGTPEICCGLNLSLAVGHTGGEGRLYASGFENGHFFLSVYSETGTLKGTWTGAATPAGTFSEYTPISIAVDNSTDPLDEHKGDVYVADPQHKVVDVFQPEADGEEHYVGQIAGPSPGEPFAFNGAAGLAVDEVNGDVDVRDGKTIDVLEPTTLGEYALVHQIVGAPSGPFSQGTGSLATGGGSGDIYTSDIVEARGPEGELLSSEIVVDQFSAAGTFLGTLSGAATPPGEFRRPYSVAVDEESHTYVTSRPTDGSGRVDAFGGNVVFPDVTTESPAAVTPFGATLSGTVNPDNVGPATCRFEWGTSRHFGNVADCEPKEVANGSSPVAVRATITGLQPDTTYFYRLQAANANGTNPGEPWQDVEFTTPGPGFREESVTDLASTSVTFQASIDPHGVPSSVYFQYGTSTSYGAEVPAPPGETIGSGEGAVEVAPQHAQGLQAGTLYHYRAVVVTEPSPGEVVVFHGPDQTFTTQTAAVSPLPDGRQWEMVSPPDKQGAKIDGVAGGVVQAAADGLAVSYVANDPTETTPQGFTAEKMQVLSTRGPGGWATRDLALAHGGPTSPPIGQGNEYKLFSADLSEVVVQPFGSFDPQLSPEASEQTAMLQALNVRCESSCFRPLVTGKPGIANVSPGVAFGEEPKGECERLLCGPQLRGATPDLRHIILEMTDSGVRGNGAIPHTAEWSSGTLTTVNVLPDGAMEPELLLGQEGNVRHALSADGSRVVMTTQSQGELYLRDLTLKKTVALNLAEAGCVGEGRCASGLGLFQLANAEGTRVVFTDKNRLTKTASLVGPDLYECEIVVKGGELECRLSDVGPETLGVVGASEDGSYLYFVANSVLAAGATPGECKELSRPEDTCSLYVRHEGRTKFVATLSNEDDHDWSRDPHELAARVSPDGEWLEFMSQRPVTGYDNRDALSGQLDAEVFLYNASTGRIVCASCNPTGARPSGAEYKLLTIGDGGLAGGEGSWESSDWVAAHVPTWTATGGFAGVYVQPRYLSNSGRLFFDSGDALVPQDVNGTQDAYEYEPSGVGDCTSASTTFGERSGGCVSLISSGTSAQESTFLEASETGGDVFFLTFSHLQPQDYDNLPDVYDAHECTSASPCFPASIPQPPACTTADACRAAPTPQPANFGAPSSATFSGAGNIVPGSGGAVTTKSLNRSQKLASSLRACKRKAKRRRASCEKRARARYGAGKPRRSTHKKGNR